MKSTEDKKPLFTPSEQKFLLELLDKYSPEKLFEETYLARGLPIPQWLAEKIAETKTAADALPEPERTIEFMGGSLDVMDVSKIKPAE